MKFTEKAITAGIEVKVVSQYQPKYSDASKRKFVFIYWIEIANKSSRTMQLLYRQWYIAQPFGIVRDVSGEGVIGQQPILGPGTFHRYNSWSELSTEIGTMEGYYTMEDVHSKMKLNVQIPKFQLVANYKLN